MAQATALVPPPPASASPSTRARVLLVEDDRASRAAMRFAMSNQGFDILEAPRLSDARRLLAEGKVDLVVVDGLLPDGLGVDLIKELRARGSTTPVIFLSSFFKDFATFKLLQQELKVVEVLRKPVVPADLLARVTRALAA